MAKRVILTDKEKSILGSVLLGLTGLFVLLTLIISSITVDPVVEGVDPTAWQSVHAWFTSVKTFFVSNYILLLLIAGVILLYYLFKKRK